MGCVTQRRRDAQAEADAESPRGGFSIGWVWALPSGTLLHFGSPVSCRNMTPVPVEMERGAACHGPAAVSSTEKAPEWRLPLCTHLGQLWATGRDSAELRCLQVRAGEGGPAGAEQRSRNLKRKQDAPREEKVRRGVARVTARPCRVHFSAAHRPSASGGCLPALLSEGGYSPYVAPRDAGIPFPGPPFLIAGPG